MSMLVRENRMKIAANFDQVAVVHSNQQPWQASPMVGVDRRPLDRVGDEVARATTIVRYAPGSSFSPHVHTGGEEFIVLEGTFQDEHGDYPQGSYVRNPPTSKHTPRSEQGCIIFVKLWQFQQQDRAFVRIPMDRIGTIADAHHANVSITPLFEDDVETVMLVHLQANSHWQLMAEKGAELLVLKGEVAITAHTAIEKNRVEPLEQYSWLRTPLASKLEFAVGDSDVTIWLKQGHLSLIDQQIQWVEQQN